MSRRALVVGISDYPDSTPSLLASVDEAGRWGALLSANQFTVMPPLLDGNATRDHVVRDLTALLTKAQAGDRLVFVYCGHGTIVDVGPADSSHAEEALYLYREAGAAKKATLTDSDIADIVIEVKLPPGVLFTIVADCCHAAGLNSVPAGGQAEFVDLLTDAEKARLGPATRFGTLGSLPHGMTAARPIILAACRSDQNAIQEPPVNGVYRLLFSRRCLEELTPNPYDTYDRLLNRIIPLAPTKTAQEPEIVGDKTKSSEHFLRALTLMAALGRKELFVRTITVRIAGTCCFVDRDSSDRPFIKRLILPFDTLSAKPTERHIPYVEFPDAHIKLCDDIDRPTCDTFLVGPYDHVVLLPDGSFAHLPLKYRRFELSEHVVTIENVDSSAADLSTLSSFDLHVPKMKEVYADLDQHPRSECFDDDPYLPLAAAFFDISKGVLKAGTLYGFTTRFVNSTTTTAKYQTPEFIELLLPITTPELVVTFTKGGHSHKVVLDDTADTITIGNQPLDDLTGHESGDDITHHFNLYYNLATKRPDDPALPEIDADPVASCTGSNWP